MQVRIVPSSVNGTAAAPPSKSVSQRAVAAAMLAVGTTVIHNPSDCDDSVAAEGMAAALGSSVTRKEGVTVISSVTKPSGPVELNCGESGLAMRMFAPMAAFLAPVATFTGSGSLVKRHVSMISAALTQFGAMVETNGGFLPFSVRGPLRPGEAVIDGSSGSQLLTGLLMTLPLLDSQSVIRVTDLRSKPYISLTTDVLSAFGVRIENEGFERFIIPGRQTYRACEYIVEGDWSGAAFLLVAGAIAGRVTVTGLDTLSSQADRAITGALEMAGASVSVSGREIMVEKAPLKAFTFDATDSPDLFPPLAVLASFCSGTSIITGTSRLESKESNRTLAITDVLRNLGIETATEGDNLLVKGGLPAGCKADSHNDHRIAMMAAVAALGASGPVTITHAEAVSKSFPGFYDILRIITDGGVTEVEA